MRREYKAVINLSRLTFHFSLLSNRQRLRLGPWPRFWWHRADEPRIERELFKNAADFAQGNSRLIHFEINDVVIAIDRVAQSPDRRPAAYTSSSSIGR